MKRKKRLISESKSHHTRFRAIKQWRREREAQHKTSALTLEDLQIMSRNASRSGFRISMLDYIRADKNDAQWAAEDAHTYGHVNRATHRILCTIRGGLNQASTAVY